MSDFERFVDNRRGDTLINVLIGVLVSMVASPAAGGFVAGYLQQEGRRSGAKVGGLVGAVTLLPAIPVFLIVLGFSGFGAFMGPRAGVGILFFLVFGLFFFVIAALSTAGLGALAGYVGGVLSEDRNGGGRSGAPRERGPSSSSSREY